MHNSLRLLSNRTRLSSILSCRSRLRGPGRRRISRSIACVSPTIPARGRQHECRRGTAQPESTDHSERAGARPARIFDREAPAMKIAQIAPLSESVPPRHYGGTERIVSYLTEELVRRGHDVTLFASGDSVTSAELVPCCDEALRLSATVRDPLPYQVMQLEKVRQRADEFDVLHFHTDLLHFPLIRQFAGRTVTTLHGRLDLPDLAPFYCEFRDIPLVSISRRSAGQCRMCCGPAMCRTDCPLTCYPSSHAPQVTTLPFSVGSHRRSGRTVPLKSLSAPA